ncbi:hypothetical protein GCM10027614_47430 [Micromonospora vulcania]
MATPQTPYDAVLHAARDVTKLDTALDAEMLGSALLGSVYAIAETDRDTAVREFVTGFLAATSRRRVASATTIRQVFAALVPTAEGTERVRPGSQAPAWTGQLGRVHLTGSWAYGDVYGDQTSYLATFAYDDAAGGPEHALVALVDHNIGITKDVFVGGPAERILDQVRQMCADDELTWFRSEDPARLRGEVARHLAVTDDMGELPGEGSLGTDRALVGARLAVLPIAAHPTGPAEVEPLSAAERTDLVRRFLAAPEAARFGLDSVDGAELASLHFCLSLLLDHSATFPDADPMRWSPRWPGSSCSTGCTAGRCWTWTTRRCCPGCCAPGRGTRHASAACPRRRRRGPTRRSRRWCRSSPASIRPVSGAAWPPPRWPS